MISRQAARTLQKPHGRAFRGARGSGAARGNGCAVGRSPRSGAPEPSTSRA